MVRFTLWLIATTVFLKTSSVQSLGLTCENYSCESGHVCVTRFFGRTCAVKEGLPCTFTDYCEGGYYCLNRKVCTGEPDGISEGHTCYGGGCKLGFYCNETQKKCLKLGYNRSCSRNSDCDNNCSYAKGCICFAGNCNSR